VNAPPQDLLAVAPAIPFAAEIGDSFRAFFDASANFFQNLAAINWLPLIAALACHGAYLSVRTLAWYNGLRAAYPEERFPWRNIWAAEIAGNGISSVIPAHAGAVVRLYLGKQTVRNSSYPTVGSSFLVEAPFDLFMGVLIIIYGFSQGVFPKPPDLSKLNAFDLSFFASHPKFAIFTLTLIPILLLALFAYLSVRVQEFWANVRQGITLLRDRNLYFRRAALPQGVAWMFRIASIWLMLEAFNVGGSLANVLTVLAVQTISSLIPFTPQGAGVQQALLVKALAGVAAGATIAAYSVGQQLAIAGFNALFGLVALAIVFRTTDWRGLMARGKAEQQAEKRAAANDQAAAWDGEDTATQTTLERDVPVDPERY
jgi:uncharacterized membrane protein YbhN (UPF0104 family)